MTLPRNPFGGSNEQGGEPGAYTRSQMSALRNTRRGQMLDKGLRNYIGRKEEIGPVIDFNTGLPNTRPQVIDLIEPQAANFSSPEKVAIDLDVSVLGAGPVDSNHLVIVTLQWGTGGGLQVAEIDARHGTQFSLVASSLKVGARYDESGDGGGPNYEISVSACYGEADSAAPGRVTRTFLQVALLNGAEQAVDTIIPHHATHLAWYSRDDPAAFAVPTATLRQKDAGGGILAQAMVGPHQWVSLVGGADLANVLNTNADGLQYGLYFSIQL